MARSQIRPEKSVQPPTAAQARFLCEALTTLATQIRNYCEATPRQLPWLQGAKRRAYTELYVQNATALTDQLDRLLEMARGLTPLESLDRERLEAMLAEARLSRNLVMQRIVIAN